MAEHFVLSSNNPNDGIGGGGCLCNPLWDSDREGPFFIFPATETDSNLSPHAVVCAGCVHSMCRKLDDGSEQLSCGETGEKPKKRRKPDPGELAFQKTGIGPLPADDVADDLDI